MPRARLRRYFRHGFFPQLLAFEACVRQGSVTRAAEELSLAQPTVSCLIRKLTETIGAPGCDCESPCESSVSSECASTRSGLMRCRATISRDSASTARICASGKSG